MDAAVLRVLQFMHVSELSTIKTSQLVDMWQVRLSKVPFPYQSSPVVLSYRPTGFFRLPHSSLGGGDAWTSLPSGPDSNSFHFSSSFPSDRTFLQRDLSKNWWRKLQAKADSVKGSQGNSPQAASTANEGQAAKAIDEAGEFYPSTNLKPSTLYTPTPSKPQYINHAWC